MTTEKMLAAFEESVIIEARTKACLMGMDQVRGVEPGTHQRLADELQAALEGQGMTVFDLFKDSDAPAPRAERQFDEEACDE